MAWWYQWRHVQSSDEFPVVYYNPYVDHAAQSLPWLLRGYCAEFAVLGHENCSCMLRKEVWLFLPHDHRLGGWPLHCVVSDTLAWQFAEEQGLSLQACDALHLHLDRLGAVWSGW